MSESKDEAKRRLDEQREEVWRNWERRYWLVVEERDEARDDLKDLLRLLDDVPMMGLMQQQFIARRHLMKRAMKGAQDG